MDSPPPQLREAVPSAELFPAQPSGPETGPAAHSSLPSGYHSSSSHPSFGSREVLEALAAAMHRLTLSSQASPAPAGAQQSPSFSAKTATDARAVRRQLPKVIRFATEPLQLQCQGHRSFVQPIVSDGVSFDLLVALDWLQKHNPRVDWDHGALMLSNSDYCYKWQAVYSDAELHDESVAIRLCTARQIRPYPAANEAYCNYVAAIQKLPEQAEPHAIPPAVMSILQDFRDMQKEPTTLPPPRNHQHGIPLYTDAEPVRKSPYGLQPPELHHVELCIQQWLSNGWIRPSCSSWAFPVFFVSKKNGEPRLVVGYRGPDSQTQPDKLPMPLIDVLIDKMSKSRVFSRLDLRKGFYQIHMADGDTFKTSFSSPVGLFEWTVMPISLINAPASLQRVRSELFRDLQFVRLYG
ncbi:hypothetical protein Efla_000139 [Eimeria flavescens]